MTVARLTTFWTVKNKKKKTNMRIRISPADLGDNYFTGTADESQMTIMYPKIIVYDPYYSNE